MPPFSPTLPLETERLRLRAFTPDDADALFDVRSRADVVRWLYDEPWTREQAEEKARLFAQWTTVDPGPLVLVMETHEGTHVGSCALRLHSAEHRSAEVGYIIHPDHQGRGYATEAARELLRLGFVEAGLHRIVGRCESRNIASAAVMERLGMRLEAHLVENEWVKGEWQSELVYALLDREWVSAAP